MFMFCTKNGGLVQMIPFLWTWSPIKGDHFSFIFGRVSPNLALWPPPSSGDLDPEIWQRFSAWPCLKVGYRYPTYRVVTLSTCAAKQWYPIQKLSESAHLENFFRGYSICLGCQNLRSQNYVQCFQVFIQWIFIFSDSPSLTTFEIWHVESLFKKKLKAGLPEINQGQ